MESRQPSVAAAIDALSDLPKLSEGDHAKCATRSREERFVVSGNRGAVSLYAECLHVPGADSFLEEPGRAVDHFGIALLLRVLTQDC
jgi:hypothetical protein